MYYFSCVWTLASIWEMIGISYTSSFVLILSLSLISGRVKNIHKILIVANENIIWQDKHVNNLAE